jgi:hypothetical protein
MPSKFRQFLRQGLLYSIEEVSLTFYVILYGIVIVTFAAVYLIMPAGNGLITTAQGISPQQMDFWTALYFSATTITTLCYGDVVPIGFSRALASSEGLLGLIFFGVMLAKATGARLAHHVFRLFVSHAENRLDQFCLQAEKIGADLKGLLALTATAFPETPGTSPTGQAEFLKSFAEAVANLHSFSVSFCQYLKTEADEGFLADSPEYALVKASDHVSLTIFVLKQIFLTLSNQAKGVVLTEINWKRTTELLNHWQQISKKISGQSKNNELKARFKAIGDMATSLSENFFSVPKVEKRQPDQEFRSEL